MRTLNQEPALQNHQPPTRTVHSQDEPFLPLSPRLDQLTAGLHALEQWYAADFEKRVADVTEVLRAQITQDLCSRFDSELDFHLIAVREQYEQRLQAYAEQLQSSRKQAANETLLEEVRRIEAALHTCNEELDRLLPDDSVALGKLLQLRTQQLELKAYLRGLRFQVKQAGL